MNKNSAIFILCNCLGIAVGIFFPWLGAPLDFVPPASQIILLVLCFLTVGSIGSVSIPQKSPVLLRLMAWKLTIVPLISGVVCFFFFPDFLLAGVLLGGSAVGVVAPFMAVMAGADIRLMSLAVLCTSLVMPLTLAILVTGVFFCLGKNTGLELWAAFIQTGITLAAYMTISFICAKILDSWFPGIVRSMLRNRTQISFILVVVCMAVIFSKFSDPILNNPQIVLRALLFVVLLSCLFCVIGFVAGWGMPFSEHMAFIISMAAMNNILVTILSSQAFGLLEVLGTSLYSLPFFILLPVYQALGRFLLARNAEQP